MRLLLVWFSIGLAACQSSIESMYQPNKEYHYEYEVQVMTGIPTGGQVYSGLKVRCTTRLQFPTASTAKLQLENIKIFKFNGLLETNPANQQLPSSMFEELTGPESDHIKKYLTRPCAFSYIRGHVTDLRTEGDDPYWSVNIKRGLISLFEVNFNERQSMQSQGSIDPSLDREEQTKMFSVMEPGVSGECENWYKVRPQRTTDGHPTMFVTKVRNYNKCLDRPVFTNTMFSPEKCTDCAENKYDWVNSEAEVRYSMLGSEHQFMIVSAIGESQHSFRPYIEEGGRAVTFINQTMVLVTSKSVDNEIRDPRSPVQQERGLKAYLPELKKSSWNPFSITQEPVKSDSPDEQTQIKEKIMKLLTAAVKFSMPAVEEEVTSILISLQELMKKATSTTLREIFQMMNQQHTHGDEPHAKMRKIFIDMLPTPGTFPAVDVIVEAITHNHLTPFEGADVLIRLSLSAYPDINSVKRVMDLIQTLHESPNRYIKNPAWLCLGAIGYKMSMMNATLTKQLAFQFQLVRKLHEHANDKYSRRSLEQKQQQLNDKIQQATRLYTKARDEIVKMVQDLFAHDNVDDKLLAVKTIGNAGFKEFFPVLEKIITDKKMPLLMRTQATWALRRMTIKVRNEAWKVLLPLFFDRTEEEDLRMACYLMFMETMPPRPHLEMIARSMWNEPSKQVSNLVYSHLRQMSRQYFPCRRSFGMDAKFALRLMRTWEPENPRLFDSRYCSGGYYWNREKMGFMTNYVSLSSAKELIPRGAATKIRYNFFGYATDFVEVGFNSRGIQSMIQKMFSQQSSSAEQPQSSHPNQQHIQDIKQQLKVSERSFDNPEGHVYIKLFGHEVLYFRWDEHILRSLMQKDAGSFASSISSLQSGMPMNIHKSTITGDIEHIIPTEAGLPLHLKLNAAGVVKVDGQMRLEMHPTLPEVMMSGRVPNTISGDVQIKPTMMLELRGTMLVDAHFIQSGMAIHCHVEGATPMSFNVNVDYPKNKILIKATPVPQMMPFMKWDVTPLTFVEKMPFEASRYPQVADIKEINPPSEATITPVEFEGPLESFGGKISFTAHIVKRHNINKLPFCPFSGKSKFVLTWMRNSPSVYNLIQFQYASNNNYRSSASQQSSRESGSWWPFSLFSSGASQETASSEIPSSSHSSSERSSRNGSERSEGASGFIDLAHEDVTIEKLIEIFRPKTTINPAGMKLGFVLRFASPGKTMLQQRQIAVLMQMDPNQPKFTYECRKAPWLTTSETHVTDLDINLHRPHAVIEPSDLFSGVYKEKIQQLIQSYITPGGKKDYLTDLPGQLATQAAQQVKKLLQSSAAQTIEEIISHVLKKETDPTEIQLKEVVQEQRSLSKVVKQILKSAADPLKAVKQMPRIRSTLEKSQSVQQKLSQRIDQTSQGQQKPSEAILIQYTIKKQQDMIDKLQKVYRKLQSVCSQSDREMLQSSITQQQQTLKALRQKQEQAVQQKQSQDQSRVSGELDPQRRSIHRSLQDIEIKLIQISQQHRQQKQRQQQKSSYSYSSSSSESSLFAMVSEVIQQTKEVKESIDAAMASEVKLEKVLRAKVLEVVLQQQQAVQDLKKRIDQSSSSQHSLRSSSSTSSEVQSSHSLMKLQQKQKEQLRQQSKQLSNRIVIAIKAESERNSLQSVLSQKDQEALRSIQKAEVKQIQASEQLQQKSFSPPSSQSVYSPQSSYQHQQQSSSSEQQQQSSSSQQTVQQIQAAIRKAEEAQEQLKRVVESIKQSQQQNIPKQLSPIVVKSLKVIAKQSEILKHTKLITKAKAISQAAKSSPDAQEAQSAKKRIEELEQQLFKVETMAASLLSVSQQSRSHSSQEPSSAENMSLESLLSGIRMSSSQYQASSESPRRVSSSSSLRSMMHKILAKQLAEEEAVRSIQFSPSQSSEQSSQEKQQISSILYKLRQSQKDLEDVLQQVRDKMETNPQDSSSKQIMKELKDSVKKQKKTVESLEDKLVQKSHSDMSAQMPLEKTQQLKDKVEQLSLQVSSQNQRRWQSSQQRRQSQERMSSAQRLSFSSRSSQERRESLFSDSAELLYTVIYRYGVVSGPRNEVHIKILGKKSVDQLLWEQKQSNPQSQDPLVTQYQSEIQEGKGRLTHSYKKLKAELNTYRHIHYMIAYHKDNVPHGLRSFMWKTTELVKALCYGQTMLYMPDQTNVPNMVEIITEFSRNSNNMLVEMKTPYETALIDSIELPPYLRLIVHPIYSRPTQEVGYKAADKCEVNRKFVRSLDGSIHNRPEFGQPCESVLAMDCSAKNSFLISSKPVPGEPMKKEVKIITASQKLEIIPQDSQQSAPRVNNNGQPMQLTEGEPKVIRLPEGSITVMKMHGKIRVSASHLGLLVESNGIDTQIQVSPFLRSKVCGLCGNYDGQSSNDMEGPAKVQYPEPMSFSSSYLIPSSQCDAVSIQSRSKVPEIRRKAAECRPIRQTEVIKREIGGQPKTCFSVQALKKCPAHCQPEYIKSKSIAFHCVDSMSPISQRLLQDSKTRVLDELHHKTVDQYFYVDEPETCITA